MTSKPKHQMKGRLPMGKPVKAGSRAHRKAIADLENEVASMRNTLKSEAANPFAIGAAMNVANTLAAEPMPPRLTLEERRAKLVAAYNALKSVQYSTGVGYSTFNDVLNGIAASIARLMLDAE